MYCLHILHDEKFIKPSIEFINKNFSPEEHFFIVVDRKFDSGVDSGKNVIRLSNKLKNTLIINRAMYRYEKIYVHSLFNFRVLTILFCQPWLLKKSNWVIWGGDLYSYQKNRTTLKQKTQELIRGFCIKNMAGLITHVKGDYQLARKWYGAKGKYFYSFMYPSNLYKSYPLSNASKNNDMTYIQIGNSADPSNNHLEVLDRLQEYKDTDIEIICPLSYSGNEEYIKQIIEVGYKIFGKEKFTPITDFMPFDKYLELLTKVDIAIFNHKRQQAMGNIITLLGLGKKVYIREEITTWQFCIDHDLKVFSANGDYYDLFEKMDEQIKQKNIENVKTKFSEEKLVEDLKKIFNA